MIPNQPVLDLTLSVACLEEKQNCSITVFDLSDWRSNPQNATLEARADNRHGLVSISKNFILISSKNYVIIHISIEILFCSFIGLSKLWQKYIIYILPCFIQNVLWSRLSNTNKATKDCIKFLIIYIIVYCVKPTSVIIFRIHNHTRVHLNFQLYDYNYLIVKLIVKRNDSIHSEYILFYSVCQEIMNKLLMTLSWIKEIYIKRRYSINGKIQCFLYCFVNNLKEFIYEFCN